MSIHYQDATITLHHGDCLDILAEMPDNSVDAVVTDPPYGLANTDPAHVAETITRWVNGERDYLPGGAGFMGKAWDAFVPPVAVWDDCMRVLKPGGHILAFAGDRTMDLTALALRLAGFEIRPAIAWLHGQGFPKSLDVSKAIDKHANAAPLWDEIRAHLRDWRDRAGMTNPDLNAALGLATNGAGMARHWTSEIGGQHSIPSKAMWQRLKVLLGWPDCDLDAAYDAVKDGADRPVIGVRTAGRLAVAPGQGEDRSARDLDITAPATDAARTWQGWGTALKPAFEPVVVARKPLVGTVAANVLAHGTGALNIDACRTDAQPRTTHANGHRSTGSGNGWGMGAYEATVPAGRWPANVVLDESQAAALDEQSGETVSPPAGSVTRTKAQKSDSLENATPDRVVMNGHGDSGGASRFFYVAPADATGDCGAIPPGVGGPVPCHLSPGHTGQHFSTTGCAGSEIRWESPALPIDLVAERFFYVAKADASERVRVDGIAHPTVKPLALMRWLVRLVTPPGGTVLEPFAGSGTTVEACILEGFRCIAVEREADYLPLIVQRINRRRDPVEAVKAAGEDAGLFDLLEGGAA